MPPRLDQDRIHNLAALEARYFQLATQNVLWRIEARPGYRIYWDPADKHAIAKAQGIDGAIRDILAHGYELPPGLEFYCTNKVEAQNRMFGRDAQWADICRIVLGPNGATGAGMTDSLARRQAEGHAKARCTCVHEIGHKLHALSIGELEFYGAGGVLDGRSDTGHQVSNYATMNKKEFVAEVFAARILGVNISPAVMQEYKRLRGPEPQDF